MSQKPKSKPTTTKSKRAKPRIASVKDVKDRIDPYKKLLARVAGGVASGLVGSPSPEIADAGARGVAAVAVDIAEEILKQVGLVPDAPASPIAS